MDQTRARSSCDVSTGQADSSRIGESIGMRSAMQCILRGKIFIDAILLPKNEAQGKRTLAQK